MLIFKTIGLCHILSFVWAFSLTPDGIISFDRFDGLCGGRNVPLKTLFRVTKGKKNVFYLNSTMTVKEDIKEKLELNIRMRRCRSKENLDTCEDFLEKAGLNYCQLTDPTIGRLSPMYVDYKPPFKCPFKKGVYRAISSKLDISLITGFPLGEFYWRVKVNVSGVETKRMVQCLEVDAYSSKARQQ